MTVLEDLAGLTVCGWPVASLEAPEMVAIRASAAGHAPGHALISSCQRIEVIHSRPCLCHAPMRRTGVEALFRVAEVAAGLDSAVMGEEQILGQVRGALAAGSPAIQAAGAIAISAARELREEAHFERHSGHLLDRAFETAGLTSPGHVAVVGAGAVGRLVALRALDLGAARVTVIGRRPPDGRWFDASAMQFRLLHELAALEDVDVLVTCLGSPARPLDAADLPPVARLVVDLGTPRNVATSAGVPVITIAALAADDDEDAALREALRERLRALLARRLEAERADGRSYAGRLRWQVEQVRAAEVARIRRLHPEIPEETADAITRSLVKQIFHHATERLRTLDDENLGDRVVALFAPPEAESVEVNA